MRVVSPSQWSNSQQNISSLASLLIADSTVNSAVEDPKRLLSVQFSRKTKVTPDTAMVLGGVPTTEAVELLRQVVDREPESVVASAATMALVKIEELSVPVLREFALSSDSRYASMGIQGSAGATREDMTTLFLELYARWEDENIRQTCLEVLVENRMKVSVHLLRRMQESGTPRIIKSADYWIAEIEKVW